MKKQNMWFMNYKSRKDSIMTLVYSLVTQQDAANNFQIAAAMKRDSTSMNSIAALTMVFLPGTFTAVSNTQQLRSRARTWLICCELRLFSVPAVGTFEF